MTTIKENAFFIKQAFHYQRLKFDKLKFLYSILTTVSLWLHMYIICEYNKEKYELNSTRIFVLIRTIILFITMKHRNYLCASTGSRVSQKYMGLILNIAITPQGDARRIAILIYGLVSFPKNTPLTRTYIKCSFSLERPHSGSSPGLTYGE